MRLGVAAIFKNECDYILEWIAYHQLIGVDRFFIADNVSDDGSSQLLEALDFLGVINRVYFPRVGETGPQAPAYNYILRQYGGEVDLLCFIDADEFIANTNGLSLKENLSAFHAMEDAGALALNWRNFGSSGHKFKGEGLVIERFKQASRKDHPANCHIKTILKPGMVQRMNIHECILESGRYYSPNLEPAVFEKGGACEPKTREVLYDRIRVNHYVVKSRQEHMLKKESKGSGAGSADRGKGEAYFKAHDLNDEFDDALTRYTGDVARGVEVLRSQLAMESPYLCFGKAHVNVMPKLIGGWAVSDLDKPLKVRLLINGKEHLVDVDRERPDLVRKGISGQLYCGFNFRPGRDMTVHDKVEAHIYGSSVKANVIYSPELGS
ncbi:glycosyltransferase family 2 protein [Microbulbifer aggregans]|uniref:glycosyltransferase family 2 protein n=1 Tax=Microbulbifer aggregans TaxID=1769779 RepID=UPI001CFECEFD|nr:glycosyltransferase family 2 protein [Microbulbifer aggregans]